MSKAASKKNAKSGETELVVTVAQSRYHVDVVDVPTTKEIDVKDLNISLGGKDILSHANLKLQENVHYVLVGRNGVGKSTVMRALAEGHVPGVSWGIRMLLLGQTILAGTALDRSVQTNLPQTVFEHVIASDTLRQRALRESKVLSTALEAHEPLAIVKAVRKLEHDALERRLAEMKEIASFRSGARGKQARTDLLALEEKVAASSLLLLQDESEIEPSIIQQASTTAVDKLNELEGLLEAIDSGRAEAKARSILLGLGFAPEKIDQPFTSLSGGWRTRCELACALFQKVNILLLDECTNFLDLPAVIWLQTYLQSLEDTTVLVITHDHDFADAVGEELLLLRDQKFETFKGNLSTYETEKRKQIKYMTRMKDALDKKTAHMENTINSNIQAAKRTGDDKKLKQAASRKKKVEERTGLEVSAKGGRFKLNRDLAGYHTTSRAAIEIPTFEAPVKLMIPSDPPALRFPGALVSFEHVSFAYPPPVSGQKSPLILSDITISLHPGERIGLCGLNGSGKSTFVNLSVGALSSSGIPMKPISGTVTLHPRVRIAHFSQHEVEALTELGTSQPTLTALGHLLARNTLNEGNVRKLLGSLGLAGATVSDVPILQLSGGQKVRLALAIVLLSGSAGESEGGWDAPHLLILDEVTTHLDSDTISALVESLREFKGAMIVVTHDRYFMRTIVEGEQDEDEDSDEEDDERSRSKSAWTPPKGKVYRFVKGQMRLLEGGMRRYEEIAEKAARKLAKG